MTFTITYRSQSGALQREVVEAANRAAALEQVKSRGITPVSVKEGGTLDAAVKVAAGRPVWIKGAVAGLLVVLCAAIAWFALKPDEQKPVPPPVKKAAKPKVEKPRAPKPPPVTNVVKKVEQPEEPDPAIVARREKLKKMTPAERLDFLFEEARQKPIDLSPSTNRAFKTGVEQVMGWIFTTRLGNLPPPLPPIMIRDEAHMAEILVANNPALEGDSEKVKDAKQMVELAKKELRQYVLQGGDVREFLQYYHGQLVDAYKEWSSTQRTVMKAIHEDPDAAAAYIEEANKTLTEKGIKPLNIPPRIKEKLGLE